MGIDDGSKIVDVPTYTTCKVCLLWVCERAEEKSNCPLMEMVAEAQENGKKDGLIIILRTFCFYCLLVIVMMMVALI